MLLVVRGGPVFAFHAKAHGHSNKQSSGFLFEVALLAPVVSVVCLVVHDEFVVHKVEAV